MKVKKSIKEVLLKLLNQLRITGVPDTSEFEKALKEYKETKEFIENLEVLD